MTVRATALFLAYVMFAQAQPPAVRVPWNRTTEILSDKYVLVQLESDTLIEGKWLAVTDNAFLFMVEKNSRRDKGLNGNQTIPRAAVRSVRFRERRVRGRVIGTVAGFYGILSIAAAATNSREAMQSGWGIAAIAGAVAGYQIGKTADKRTRDLVIEP